MCSSDLSKGKNFSLIPLLDFFSFMANVISYSLNLSISTKHNIYLQTNVILLFFSFSYPILMFHQLSFSKIAIIINFYSFFLFYFTPGFCQFEQHSIKSSGSKTAGDINENYNISDFYLSIPLSLSLTFFIPISTSL